jgi:hypothetical protein
LTPTLPPKLARLVEGGVVDTPAIAAVRAWLESRATDVLVLHGGTGSGKSLAAAWAFAFTAHRHRVSPLWCDAPEMSTVADWSSEWAAFDSAPLLVIDDLGSELERKRERMQVALERVFNLAGGRAIVTTNVHHGAMLVHYGQRVQSRMVGTSSTWFSLSDPDYRIAGPTGGLAPAPVAETQRELAAKERAEDERRRRDEVREVERREAERFGASALEELRRLMGSAEGQQR